MKGEVAEDERDDDYVPKDCEVEDSSEAGDDDNNDDDGADDESEATSTDREHQDFRANTEKWMNWDAEPPIEPHLPDNESEATSTDREYQDFRANTEKWTKWCAKPPIEPRLPDRFKLYVAREEGRIPDRMEYQIEHIAGPGCVHRGGYHGHAISLQEMRGCNTFQFLLWKGNISFTDSDNDDEEFELRSDYHLTGLGDFMPSRDDTAPYVDPVRHGANQVCGDVVLWGGPTPIFRKPQASIPSAVAMPFHPTCFDIFCRLSRLHFGRIDLNGLMGWRDLTSTKHFVTYGFPRDAAVKRGSQDYWDRDFEHKWLHIPGDEWLAANPLFVPALNPILARAVSMPSNLDTPSPIESQLDAPQSLDWTVQQIAKQSSRHFFEEMPQELRDRILDHLNPKDIANLRLASRAFHQIPNIVFHRLMRREMPWLWEAWTDDQPNRWAVVSVPELRARLKRATAHRERVQRYREIIAAEYPEVYYDVCAAEPEHLDEPWPLGPERIQLPVDRTDWHQLYCDISRNWKDLKGLRNRARIWTDVEEIIRHIKQLRQEGRLPGLDETVENREDGQR